MTTSAWYDRMDIQAAGIDLEAVSDFCYGRHISYKGSCEKDVGVRIGKAAAVFGKMRGVWKSSKISLRMKMRLYESVILSTLLYSAESWPSATSLKQLNCAHHRWQRSILSVSWKDKITNQEVRARTKQYSIASTLSERRLRWLGHVLRTDYQRIPQQAPHWLQEGTGSAKDKLERRSQEGSAYSKRVPRTNCALRIKKCAPRISSGIYFLSTS